MLKYELFALLMLVHKMPSYPLVAVGRSVKSGKKCLLLCHFCFCAAGTEIVFSLSLRRQKYFNVCKFTP
jgi:hypothetical protein